MAGCYLLLEDGSGRLMLEDGSGFLLLETCNDAKGGGAKPYYKDYDPVWAQEHKYNEEQRRLAEKKRFNDDVLAKKEKELAILEKKREKDLDDERLQFEVLALLKHIHELEQERLRLEELMMFFRQDEEDVVLLLLAMSV